MNKKIAKKWWLWLLLILLISAFVFALLIWYGIENYKKSKDIDFSTIVLGSHLPKTDLNRGMVHRNNYVDASVEFFKVKKGDYNDYVQAAIEAGYVIESADYGQSYVGYNEEGYCIHVSFKHGYLSVFLEAPWIFEQIEWPDSDLASRLPIPKSLSARRWADTDGLFKVFLEHMTREDLEEYIVACRNKGFVLNEKRMDEDFLAFNEEGYKLELKYEGFNRISIAIWSPEALERR